MSLKDLILISLRAIASPEISITDAILLSFAKAIDLNITMKKKIILINAR